MRRLACGNILRAEGPMMLSAFECPRCRWRGELAVEQTGVPRACPACCTPLDPPGLAAASALPLDEAATATNARGAPPRSALPTGSEPAKAAAPAAPVEALAETGLSNQEAELERARSDPARRLGPFLLLGELGKGGMGVVFRAWDERLRRLIALKTIQGDEASASTLQRFQREAQAIARLRHPNVVTVFEAGEVAGRRYIAMELLDGTTLDRRVDARSIPLTRALEALRDVARAVQYAHDQGVIHRDLKPQNIIIDGSGRPHVLDFGIALVASAPTRITRTGAQVGTLAYMPPEQARGGTADARSDVYSLGATLYHVLAGRAPFACDSAIELLASLASVDPAPPSSFNRRAAGDLDTICLACLHKDPDRRYPTAAALADDLDRYLSGDPISARPIGPIARLIRRARRNRLAAAATILVLASAGAGAAWHQVDRWSTLATAREKAERALADLEESRKRFPASDSSVEARRARQDGLLALGLAAFQAALHVTNLAPEDPEARALAFESSLALGETALEAEQWSVAAGAFQSAKEMGIDPERVGRELARVDAARRKVEEDRRRMVERILKEARSGRLDRQTRHQIIALPDSGVPERNWSDSALEDAVFTLVGLRDQQTVELLARALDEVTRKLAQGEPATVSPGDVLVARLACEALGRIGIAQGAIPALGRYLRVEKDEMRAVHAGTALCRLDASSPELEASRQRFGPESGFWSYVATELALAWFDRGLESERRGDLDGSISAFRRAAELDPSLALARKECGDARARKGDLEGALSDYEQAIEIAPGLAGPFASRANVLRQKGELDRALEDARNAVELEPLNPAAWSSRALVLGARGDVEAEIADLTRALELEPNEASWLRERGLAREKKGDRTGARADLERSLELAPGDGRAPEIRVKLQELRGRP